MRIIKKFNSVENIKYITIDAKICNLILNKKWISIISSKKYKKEKISISEI